MAPGWSVEPSSYNKTLDYEYQKKCHFSLFKNIKEPENVHFGKIVRVGTFRMAAMEREVNAEVSVNMEESVDLRALIRTCLY